jgi:polar amino acid transport system substrate-binding protein
MLPAGAAAQETTLQKIIRTKKFNIGYVVSPPTSVKDPNTQELKGFHPDAVRWICDQLKVECVFHEVTWATFAAGLQAGKYDLSVAGTFTTMARSLAVAFTNPLYYKGEGAIALKTSEIKTVADLKKPGLRVTVVQGTSEHDWAQRNLPQAKLVVSTAEPHVALLDVIAGRSDVGLADSLVTAEFAERYPQARDVFAERPYLIFPVSWAVRPEDAHLLRVLNNAITLMELHGVFGDIERKYQLRFHLRPTPPFRQSW